MTLYNFGALGDLGSSIVGGWQAGNAAAEADRKRQTLASLGKSFSDPNADYRALAGQALGIGDSTLATGLLAMGQQQASRAADASFFSDAARAYGGGGAGGAPRTLADLAPTAGNSSPADFSAVGDRYGLNPQLLSTTRTIESNGNDSAVNAKSGAAGAFQFVPTTARAYGLTNPNDPAASADAAARLAVDNRTALRQRLGRDVTDSELYLAHQQGAGGAGALLSANPNTNVVDALAPAYNGDRAKAAQAVTNNGGSPDDTAGQFVGRWRGKYGAAATANGNAPDASPVFHSQSAADDDAATVAMGLDGGTVFSQADRSAAQGRLPAGAAPTIVASGAGIVPSREQGDRDTASGTAPSAPTVVADPRKAQTADQLPAGYKNAVGGLNIGGLLQHLANPNLSSGARDFAKTLLTRALDNNEKLPDAVKEYVWARGNGQTTSSYPDWLKEKAGKDDAGDKITKEVNARREAASSLGLDPNSTEGRNYIATGKIGRDEPPDRRAIFAADEAVAGSRNAISAMDEALKLSGQAYDGPTAGGRGWLMSNFNSADGNATEQLGNVVTSNALQSLKATFGGNPTEGERKVLLDIQGSVNQPRAVRDEIFNRAKSLAQRRLELNQERASELRGGTYYKPGGGAAANNGPQARTPVNIPDASVQALKDDPSLRAQFDAKYGAGSSDTYLGR